MLQFFLKNPNLLMFGMLTAMFSGPGQTFLVSLFIPHMRSELHLSQTAISLLYSGATLASAFFLPFLGSMLDKMHLIRFALMCGFLLMIGCIVLGLSYSWIMIFAGFFLIRNLGQGALSMTSSTTMARYFGVARGKALGIANMGYPLSEALFPVFITTWIASFGWRSGWFFLAGLILLFFLPSTLYLLRNDPHKNVSNEALNIEEELSKNLQIQEHWSIKQIARSPKFYLLLYPALIPPALLTALFFHHMSLMSHKSWDISVVALAFAVYGISRAPISFLVGPLVDRYTARKLYQFSLVPMLIGLLCFLFGKQVNWVFPYLAFAGVSMGFGMTVSGALWAELFGTKNLGSIRGFMTGTMVLSTAASPVIVGYLLDRGIQLDTLLQAMILMTLGGICSAFLGCALYRPTKA